MHPALAKPFPVGYYWFLPATIQDRRLAAIEAGNQRMDRHPNAKRRAYPTLEETLTADEVVS